MAATLQYLTKGQLMLEIGAGWQADEYRAYGYEYPSAGIRVAQLGEAISILRRMWTESPATFRGTYYQVENAYCEPRPAVPFPDSLSPGVDARVSCTAGVALTWSAVDAATSYRVTIARDLSFRDVVGTKTVRGTRYTFKPEQPGTYAWRIASRGRDGRYGENGFARRIFCR